MPRDPPVTSAMRPSRPNMSWRFMALSFLSPSPSGEGLGVGARGVAQGLWPPPAATKPASWQVSLPSPEGEGVTRSIAVHSRNLVDVIMHIAHLFRQGAVAFHIEADVIFVGHADAAVHLDALTHREVRGAAGLRLGDRDH